MKHVATVSEFFMIDNFKFQLKEKCTFHLILDADYESTIKSSVRETVVP